MLRILASLAAAALYALALPPFGWTILGWLTPINYTSQQNDFFNRRQAGTNQWLLDSSEYQK